MRALGRLKLLVLLLTVLVGASSGAQSRYTPIERCPIQDVQPRPADFQPGGLILTSFDRASLWVLNIDGKTRYPLPETRPCGTNCHLSPDKKWISYLNPLNTTFSKMRLDGTERTPIANEATDVAWWSDDALLIWTPGHRATLLNEANGDAERLTLPGAITLQPMGRWALTLDYEDEAFRRALTNLDTQERLPLGVEAPFFSASSWSPDGYWLAYVVPNADGGGELYGVHPEAKQPGQWTDFTNTVGAVRIGGQTPIGGLSWSPDAKKVAFWVVPLTGANPAVDTGDATIHLFDTTTGQLTRYCGFSTLEHTPNPPRLVWSPDSTHLAFGGNVPEDSRGYLLLALNIETGIYTELSEGIYPALGSADVVAWGLPPG